MPDYKFEVSDIDWVNPDPALPAVVHVMLSKYLVEAEPIDDDAWDEAINDELEALFGSRASDFGFELID